MILVEKVRDKEYDEQLESLFSKLWERNDSFWIIHADIIRILNGKNEKVDYWMSRLLDEMEKADKLDDNYKIMCILNMSGGDTRDDEGGVHLICTKTKLEARMVEVMNQLINFSCGKAHILRLKDAVKTYEEACEKYIKNRDLLNLITREKDIIVDNSPIMELKSGDYTMVNNREYRVTTIYDEQEKRSKVAIYTYDIEDTDESFSYNEMFGRYYKVVDSRSLGDVYSYTIKHYYKGHLVEKCVGKKGEITIFSSDFNFALANGFREFDRGDYIKEDVLESEIVSEQIGPELNGRYKFL